MTSQEVRTLRAELETMLRARDRPGAARITLAAVREGRVTPDDVYTGVLTPLLIDTGASWAAGSTSVWQEHLTSSIVRTVIESLAPDVADAAAAVTPTNRTALLACPSGEQHDLGLRMLTDRLLLRGWKAHFLGADTPAPEVIAAARALGADTVILSAATHYNLVLLRAFVDEVQAALPGVRIGVGGPAFACNHDWPPEYLFTSDDLGFDDDPAGVCDLPDQGA